MANDLKELHNSLLYLHMAELQHICEQLQIPTSGMKMLLIERIVQFLKTGNIKHAAKIPPVSRSQKDKAYPLKPSTLILYGSYKNDAATRTFMKQLVGDHFQFTAAGQAWIKERWFAGNPPTYKEFANWWQEQHDAKKHKIPQPNKEWAYLNFIQQYFKQNPEATRAACAAAWKQKRETEKKKALLLLKQILK